jgi:hypothetical protein
MKTYGGSGGITSPFSTSALEGGKWSASSPGLCTLRGKSPGTHCIGGGLSPNRPGRRGEEKNHVMRGIEIGPSSPVDRRYTD